MSEGVIAAIDLGATSGRVLLARVGSDTLTSSTVARFANEPVATNDGLHWDMLALYDAAVLGLRTAFRQEPSITSIGVDSWAVDYGLLREGRLLGEPFHYRDARTATGVERVHERVTHAALFARNGLQFLPFNTLYQLAAEPSALLGVADTALLIPDLLSFWLTGRARAERTNASTTGLLHVSSREWDDELIAALGLPRGILPPLIDAGEQVGTLLPGVAGRIGAPDGTRVTAVGSHDTASAVVAVPMRPEAAAYISCGTWGLVGVEVERPVLTDAAREAGFTNEGGVDGRVRLLHNVMGLWILNEAVREWERADGGSIDLAALLASARDARCVVFDANDPRFLAPGDMVDRIDHWCDEHAVARPRTRPEYVRSIVDSLADAFAAAVWDAARLGGVEVTTIHLVGGGAQGELLCQRTADRAGIPVLAGPVEATALGNVLVQARAAGLISGSLDSLRDLVARTHPPRRFDPRR
ncbi:rhamnulokinase [Microbacterium sp.]|uniref:rhamnulokinase n=1 Tax=Microbacterium sp. TaxID=51671 RepID=UPI0039E6E5DD